MCNNARFWVIFTIELLVQHFFLVLAQKPIGSKLLGLAPVSNNIRFICIGLGLSVLVVFPLSKLIPLEKFAFMRFVDLEDDLDNNLAKRLMERSKEELQQR